LFVCLVFGCFGERGERQQETGRHQHRHRHGYRDRYRDRYRYRYHHRHNHRPTRRICCTSSTAALPSQHYSIQSIIYTQLTRCPSSLVPSHLVSSLLISSPLISFSSPLRLSRSSRSPPSPSGIDLQLNGGYPHFATKRLDLCT
jgi:hypothetical protein